MVREIPCNAWALGFSGTHHIKHVVARPLTQRDFKTEWTKGIPLYMQVLQRVWRVSSFSSPLKVSPRACESSKELFTLSFYFVCYFCVYLLDQFHFLFSHSSSNHQSQSFHLTWAFCFSYAPGSPGMSEAGAAFSVRFAWAMRVVSH